MREKSSIAVSAIENHPMRFVRLSLKRVAIFWTALGGNHISRMVIAEITGTSLFAFAGLGILWRRSAFGTGLLLVPFLVFPLPYYMTHPDFRFRLLLEPLALMVAGWVIMRISEAVENSYRRKLRTSAPKAVLQMRDLRHSQSHARKRDGFV